MSAPNCAAEMETGMEFQDNNALKDKAKMLVSQMTLEEKAGLCSGKDCWKTKPIERLGLESITMMDGPHGLRKQIGATDNLGIGKSVPAVCFPTASALACSFDRDLVFNVGKAIGEECVHEGVSVILGPGINQKRNPLCGRNFEYFSEDPTLSGELAASMIKGVQSTGTATSLKHFAVNNQEKRRMTISTTIDERTLRETYLKAFEIAVKKGKPDTVMCSYNKLNGTYCSENKYLLTDILRNEWNFNGLVVSDWGAVHDRPLGIKAGLDLEMPGSNGINDLKIIEAVNNNTLSIEDLDRTVLRITELILKAMQNKKNGYTCDKDEHHKLAIKAAEQSAVLLKNDSNLLPGNINQKAAVIGAFAKSPRFQGVGSSKINPYKIETPLDAFAELGLDITYADGYSLKSSKRVNSYDQDYLINEACEAAKDKDIVYLFAGLPEGYESEGFDRKAMSLPQEQNRLIDAVCKCNPNVVVILIGGAPVELPWIENVKSVLLAYLCGEGMGKAIPNLLLGIETPSGKLAETWPLALEDCPSYNYFPGNRLTVEHRESIYVGYRYYEKANKPVLFPFGHGLSYANFKYSDLILEKNEYSCGDKISLTFNITNCSNKTARETAFIFVSYYNQTVFVPKKELREFIKVELNPNETKQVSLCLDTNDFGYYNTIINDWYSESGSYKIMVGSSLTNCPLVSEITLNTTMQPQPYLTLLAPSYYQLPKNQFTVSEKEFESLYGKEIPISDCIPSRPYNYDNTLEDVENTLIGKIILKYADYIGKKAGDLEAGQEGMLSAMIKEMPFFAMVTSGDGMISQSMMEGIIDMLNGHYIKGIRKLFK